MLIAYSLANLAYFYYARTYVHRISYPTMKEICATTLVCQLLYGLLHECMLDKP